MAEVELRHVEMRFGDSRALVDLSLTVHEGEFLTLLGPSGCGKSTTLNLIAGLLEPSRGEIRIGGRRVNGLPPKARHVAMVFQDYALYPHMTVFQNLAFPLRAMRMPDDEIRKKVERVVALLGIAALVDRVPKELSGGQRQRVALGRALVRDPQVFLMDEPLSNLDARLRVAMRTELKQLHRRLRATVVYVTHDQAEAMTLSGRIALLENGVLQQVGTPREIYERPANQFVASFMGTIGMNFIGCTVEEMNGHRSLARGEFRVLLAEPLARKIGRVSGGQVIVGLRPEHLTVRVEKECGIPGVVEVVEYLGSETLLYLKVGDASLIAKGESGEDLQPGQPISLLADWQRACVFDVESKALIGVNDKG